jgi:alkaline phosphatase
MFFHMRRIISVVCVLVIAMMAMAQAKYVFMFIGDGMGPHQVLSTEMYLAELEGKIGRKQLLMTTFPYSGQAATFSASSGITDSAASGTCLATGKKTNNGVIGLAHDSTPVYSVASQLKEQGWGVGIMTTVTIDHATPSAHYAHTPSRNDYYIIGTQLTESNFDFFGGSGFSSPQDKSNASAPNLYDLAEQKGYTIAGGYADAKNKIGSKKLLVVPEERLADRSRHAGALPYAIDREDKDLRLSQIVELAIAQLSTYDRFFMMAEGGKIDYASHANDGATVLHEVMDFDEAIKVAYRFYEQHPDETLIVITADHETGGMALGNSDYVLNLKVLANQQCSLDKLSDQLSELQKAEGKNLQWEQVRQLISKNTGLYAQVEMTGEEDALLQESFASMMSHQDVVKTLYKDLNALAAKALAILNKKSRLGWTSGGHTASAVPIFAIGVGAERFTGWHDNSEIAPLIYQATQYR